MSEVINTIFSFSIIENEKERINEVNKFHNNGRLFNLKSVDLVKETSLFKKNKINKWYGGSKNLETPLYIGAFNHLDLTELIIYLKQIKWEEPENVQLIVKKQNSDKFEILEII